MKLLCWLGWHRWRVLGWGETSDYRYQTERCCVRCNKRQIFRSAGFPAYATWWEDVK